MKQLHRVKTAFLNEKQSKDDGLLQDSTIPRARPSILRVLDTPTSVLSNIFTRRNHYHIPVCNMLPVELWREIFAYLTDVPGKKGLSLDASSFYSMICDDPTYGFLFEMEHWEIRRQWLEIIQVCKYWYSIGISSLWSHIILSTRHHTEYVHRILQKYRALRPMVIHITITYEPDSPSALETTSQLIQLLPNLKSIKFPVMFGTIADFVRPEIVVLFNPTTNQQLLEYFGGDQWRSIRVVIINYGWSDIIISLANSVELPKLEFLHVGTYRQILPYITDYWNMPSIRTLSIEGYTTRDVHMRLISKCAQHLEKIELLVLSPPVILKPKRVYLEKLKILYIAADCKDYVGFIRAPKVARLGLCELPDHRQYTPTKKTLDSTLSLFPNITELCFSRFRCDIAIEDVQAWEEMGLRVTVK